MNKSNFVTSIKHLKSEGQNNKVYNHDAQQVSGLQTYKLTFAFPLWIFIERTIKF